MVTWLGMFASRVEAGSGRTAPNNELASAFMLAVPKCRGQGCAIFTTSAFATQELSDFMYANLGLESLQPKSCDPAPLHTDGVKLRIVKINPPLFSHCLEERQLLQKRAWNSREKKLRVLLHIICKPEIRNTSRLHHYILCQASESFTKLVSQTPRLLSTQPTCHEG